MNILAPISCLTVVPLLGAIAVLLLGAKSEKLARGLALVFAILALAITLILWHRFNSAFGGLQFEEVHAWIPVLGVQYHVGIDGLGLLMLGEVFLPVLVFAPHGLDTARAEKLLDDAGFPRKANGVRSQ